jgi:phage tail sheath protein FI
MPGTYTYPGVYVEEIPSGVHTIINVSTSDTGFAGWTLMGPIDRAVRLTGFADFEREFGGLDERSEVSYAIYQYFLNGGSIAWMVRVAAYNATRAMRSLVASQPGAYYGYGYGTGQYQEVFKVSAASPGIWGHNLQMAVDYKGTQRELDSDGKPIENKPLAFNLVVREMREVGGRPQVGRVEIYRNLYPNQIDSVTGLLNPRYAASVINEQSSLIRLADTGSGELPEKNGEDVTGNPDKAEFLWLGQDGYWNSQRMHNEAKPEWQGNVDFEVGSDGFIPGSPTWIASEGSNALLGKAPSGFEPHNQGIYMLETIAPYIFNILCLPEVAYLSDTSRPIALAEAAAFCELKRAFLIVDIPPEVITPADMTEFIIGDELPSTKNAAVYYPRLSMPDPLNENRPREVGSSGSVAGIYARTDAQRGVWKAPAGTDATLRGIELMRVLTDLENGGLNPLGANVLRNFPIYRNVVWGARTLEGADQRASEWKYVPVRRMALFLEESLSQGLKWAVFEPNDEPLWASIRLNVGAFMQSLFRQGAFQGSTPREAYFVKCDKETTTQTDINMGIVNIVVGFAPLRPAEFVVIKIQQMSGQIPI